MAKYESRLHGNFDEILRTADAAIKILSCGDLDPKYLEFLVTMTNCPLLYVNGNHDRKYLENPPEGCICIENRVYDYKGLRLLGDRKSVV